ncbi:MAG: hypothetical protein HYZ57_20755 [Acidobacteria bacterium]|nr:hypothetical protein [Acidobacteriota bacterium]
MNPRWMLTGLVALAAAALLFAALREAIAARPAAISLVALALLELGSNATAELPSRFQPELKSNLKKYSQVSDIASFLRSRDGLVRFEVDEREIPFNLGDWFGLEQWNGFLASLTENVERLERHTDRTGSLFAVNYAIASKPYRPGQVIEFENPNGLKVLRNPAALPRVRTVHELVKLKQPGEVARFIEDVDNDLSRTAVVFDNLPDLERCQSDWVRLVSQETSRVTIVASMACRGMVILADTYFPGWQARIDGEPARLYAPFGVLRGVVVERGDHLIDMEYRPRSVLAGGIASGIGLVLALIGAAWPRQKKA